jgi:hypothetical protein
VYFSTNSGDSWTKLNTSAFPTSELTDVRVSKWTPGGAVVYAVLSSAGDGTRLRVYDNGTWYERSTGLFGGVRIKNVSPHPTNPDVAYAILSGIGTYPKVYRTTNRGLNWTNVTGNLPTTVPYSDLVAHPTDPAKLYLGSEFGCYRTTDGGTNWHRWNNGMPQANIVTEMKYIDSLAINGKFYVLAGTYGRSIWMRDVSGDDPTEVAESSPTPADFRLYQNYPNPFNPSTTIQFSIPQAGFVTMKVYDLLGKEIKTLVDANLEAGVYSARWDASAAAGGVYFYELHVGDFVQARKLIVLK